MADTLLDVKRLPPRSVNILTNDRSDGDHTFVIHGPNFEQQYTFPDSPAIDIIRDDLLKICSEVDAKGKPVKYLFSDNDNSGNQDKLVADLMKLAPTGYALYFDLIALPANATLERSLRDLLAKPGTIQISVSAANTTSFPGLASTTSRSSAARRTRCARRSCRGSPPRPRPTSCAPSPASVAAVLTRPIPTSSARWDFGASDTTSKPCRRRAGIRLRQSTPGCPDLRDGCPPGASRKDALRRDRGGLRRDQGGSGDQGRLLRCQGGHRSGAVEHQAAPDLFLLSRWPHEKNAVARGRKERSDRWNRFPRMGRAVAGDPPSRDHQWLPHGGSQRR